MRLLLALLLVLSISSAHAVLAPEYYENARRDADSVLVVQVERVVTLPFWRGYGACRVRGSVEIVERGDRYRAGDPVEIEVPCMRRNADIPAGPVLWADHAELRNSRWGRAWLTPEGALALYQYEILARRP